MEYLQIRNWGKWQSYRKDRGQPPWIKIHRCVMRNPEWVLLSDAERGQLVSIWLLAADRDGEIPSRPEIIKKLCYMESEPDLDKFKELGFIDDNLASPWRQDGVNMTNQNRIEKNRIETEKSVFSVKKSESDFNEWYAHYPLKKSRQAALKKWLTLDRKGSLPDLPILLAAVEQQKREKESLKESGKFCPEWKHPSTWLNKGCWEDEIESTDCYEEPAEKYLGEN